MISERAGLGEGKVKGGAGCQCAAAQGTHCGIGIGDGVGYLVPIGPADRIAHMHGKRWLGVGEAADNDSIERRSRWLGSRDLV